MADIRAGGGARTGRDPGFAPSIYKGLGEAITCYGVMGQLGPCGGEGPPPRAAKRLFQLRLGVIRCKFGA